MLFQAEQQQEKVRKSVSEESSRCCPPPVCPKFTKEMEELKLILSSDVMIEILYLVLKRCSKKSRVSSEGQLQRVGQLANITQIYA